MKLKRFVIMNADGRYVATVYAERFDRHDQPANSSTGAIGGHFRIGTIIVGSFEFGDHDMLLGELGDGSCGELTVDVQEFTTAYVTGQRRSDDSIGSVLVTQEHIIVTKETSV